ncbi:Na+/melibiose symporter-like transporter [Streptacidiphilus sp. MAP12-20]
MRSTLWRHRDFLLLWGGGSASDLGSAVSALLIPLMAVQSLGATTLQIAMLSLARRVPPMLLSLPAGVLADSARRRRIMIWCDLACMLAVFSIPATSLLGGRVGLWQLYLVAAFIGSATVLFSVADTSYLPNVLERDQLVDGNAKLNATETAADAAGPALGALLAGAVTAARAIAFDALSYGVSVLALLLMRTPDPKPQSPRAGGVTFRSAMTEGLSYVWRDRSLRAIACCAMTANLGVSGVVSLEVLYLVRELQVAPALVGVVVGIGVLGGFAGSLGARSLARRFGSARIMWLSLLVCAPVALLMPLATPGYGIVLYSLGWGVFNFGAVVHQTAQMTYRQLMIPQELLGRANASIRWVVLSAVPLGILLGGVVGTRFGLQAALWVATGLIASTWLWLLASPLRTLRDLPV